MNINHYLEFMSKLIISTLDKCDLKLTYYINLLKLMGNEVALMCENLRIKHYVDLLRSLKILIEASIQLLYYFSKYGVNEEGVSREVKRREKSATTFNIKMIGKIRDLHLSIKKEIIKTYLDISKFTHPTKNLLLIHERKHIDENELRTLLHRATDIVAYCILRVCRVSIVSNELLRAINELGLERSLKYIGRKGSEPGPPHH